MIVLKAPQEKLLSIILVGQPEIDHVTSPHNNRSPVPRGTSVITLLMICSTVTPSASAR